MNQQRLTWNDVEQKRLTSPANYIIISQEAKPYATETNNPTIIFIHF